MSADLAHAGNGDLAVQTEGGTHKPPGGECAREWPDGPPGDSYYEPPPDVPDIPPPPVASFTYSPPSPSTGDMVTFDGSASYTNLEGAAITAYAWLFNHQATRSGVACTWRLPSGSGDYDATLTVTDSGNLTGTTTQVITI